MEREAGGRDALRSTLMAAATSPQLEENEEQLIQLLADPEYNILSLPRLCSLAQVSLVQFLRLLNKASGAKAAMAAMEKVHSRLPATAEDLMSRTIPHEVTCPACLGTAKVWKDGAVSPDSCPSCYGQGKIPREADIDRQKLALEMGGLLKRNGGINIQQNQQVNVANAGPLRTTVEFREAIGRLLYPGRERTYPKQEEPIDAQATPVEES